MIRPILVTHRRSLSPLRIFHPTHTFHHSPPHAVITPTNSRPQSLYFQTTKQNEVSPPKKTTSTKAIQTEPHFEDLNQELEAIEAQMAQLSTRKAQIMRKLNRDEQYDGNKLGNMRHGFGTLRDGSGETIYEGEWC